MMPTIMGMKRLIDCVVSSMTTASEYVILLYPDSTAQAPTMQYDWKGYVPANMTPRTES